MRAIRTSHALPIAPARAQGDYVEPRAAERGRAGGRVIVDHYRLDGTRLPEQEASEARHTAPVAWPPAESGDQVAAACVEGKAHHPANAVVALGAVEIVRAELLAAAALEPGEVLDEPPLLLGAERHQQAIAFGADGTHRADPEAAGVEIEHLAAVPEKDVPIAGRHHHLQVASRGRLDVSGQALVGDLNQTAIPDAAG
jgi:hypothetical protein